MTLFRRVLAPVVLVILIGLASARPGAAPAVRLAVLELTGSGAVGPLASLGEGLQSIITTDLSNVASLTLIERARLRDLRDELKLSRSALTDPATAAKLGKLAGATHLAVGTFTVVGKVLRLDCRVIAVSSGQVVLAASAEGETEAFFEVEKALVNKLIAGIGLSLSAKERGAVARIHTTDFEAFRTFSDGVRLFDDKKYDEALSQLRSASQRDEEFKLARVTLEAYERLVNDLRSQAKDMEIARAEVERMDRDKAAATVNGVRKKLFDLAARKGPEHREKRALALYLLTRSYEAPRRGRLPGEDRFARERTADALAQRYWAEAAPLFPAYPPLVNDAMRDPPRVPASVDEWDAALARAEKRLTTWDLDVDGPNAEHFRKLLKTYRLAGLDSGTEEFARRLHLDRRGEAELLDKLFALGLRLDPDTAWKKHRVEERAKLRRQLLDLDASTKLFASIRGLDADPQWLRHLAHEAETNGKLAAALAAAPPRSLVREYVMLAVASGSAAPLSNLERDFVKGELTPIGAYRLTDSRELRSGGFILVGDVPAWTSKVENTHSGTRRDPLRTDELRYALPAGYRASPDLVMTDGVPRRDVQISLELSYVQPRDFWPTSPMRGDTFETRKPSTARPTVMVLLRARDVQRDDDQDPVTNKRIANPMKALALVVAADGVRLVEARIEHGQRWSSTTPDMKLTTLGDLGVVPTSTSASIPITVRAVGGKVTVAAAGRSATFNVSAAGDGFTGLLFQGEGYVGVRKLAVGRP